MAKENLKQGFVVIPDAAKRLRRELNGEVITDFYGEHHFKKGQTAVWNETGEFGFFAINGISAEKLVAKGVCTKELDKENEAVKYEITKDCTLKISHGGTEEFARKGKVEVRNITIYELLQGYPYISSFYGVYLHQCIHLSPHGARQGSIPCRRAKSY